MLEEDIIFTLVLITMMKSWLTIKQCFYMHKCFLNSFPSNILQNVTVFLFQYFLLHITSSLKWYIPIPQDKSNFVSIMGYTGITWDNF